MLSFLPRFSPLYIPHSTPEPTPSLNIHSSYLTTLSGINMQQSPTLFYIESSFLQVLAQPVFPEQAPTVFSIQSSFLQVLVRT